MPTAYFVPLWMPSTKAMTKKAWQKRLGYLGSGLAYAGLGITALTGLGSSGGGDKKEEMTAKALTFPGANWIIGIIGIAILVAGIFQWVKIYKGSYRSKFTLDSFATGKRHWVERLAKLGLGARGVIFIIIGISVIVSAYQSDPGEVMGLGEALKLILAQSYGAILLGLTALGLVCYAIYCGVLAVWGNFGS